MDAASDVPETFDDPEPVDEPEPLEALVAHAHEARVVVIGGGVAGAVAAWECAKVGIPVTLFESSDRLGGVIRSAEIAGLRIDLAAEGYSTKGAHVRALVEQLGLGDRIIAPEPAVTCLSGSSGAVPAPSGTVLGIPENTWDEPVRRLIGWRGAWRAYLDRLRPPLTIGQERSLGRLVRTRMGERVLDRLVAPLSLGAFAIHPDDVDVDVAAPGLSAALTRTGSLSGAVAQVRAGRAAAAGGALESIDGGMSPLIDALEAKLAALGVEVRLESAASAIERRADGRWTVIAEPASADRPNSESPDFIVADAVVVATSEDVARRLLAPVVPTLGDESFPTADLEVITLVVSCPALTSSPRRTAVYPLPGTSSASALTIPSTRWGWLRRSAEADTHVLRVTFGGPVGTPPTAALDDDAATALALAEASALLGITIDSTHLRGAHRERYAQPRPASALSQSADSAAVRRAVGDVEGLSAVGAWVAGTGLAQVVPDAIDQAERVRRSVLWRGADRPA